MTVSNTVTAFAGDGLLASGAPLDVALAIKAALAGDPALSILAFDDRSGRQVDFDLRGTDTEIAARLRPATEPAAEAARRGAGRPKLGVVAREFRLTFSRPYVKAGKLILEFNNQGEDVHNLRITRGSGGPVLASVDDTSPRQQKTIEIPLKPGTYRLWCALPSHAKLGMKTRLKVVAPNR